MKRTRRGMRTCSKPTLPPPPTNKACKQGPGHEQQPQCRHRSRHCTSAAASPHACSPVTAPAVTSPPAPAKHPGLPPCCTPLHTGEWQQEVLQTMATSSSCSSCLHPRPQDRPSPHCASPIPQVTYDDGINCHAAMPPHCALPSPHAATNTGPMTTREGKGRGQVSTTSARGNTSRRVGTNGPR
jgi:hypothetical protein